MDYMDRDIYMRRWRFRIFMLRVFFLDGNNRVIKNNDTVRLFGMGVTYPSMFYDMDQNKVPHLFTAEPHYCTSYYKHSGSGDFVEDCALAKESEVEVSNYAPSPNGTFTFELLDSESLDMDRFKKLKIEIYGSFIPFEEQTTSRPQKYRFLDIVNNMAKYHWN